MNKDFILKNTRSYEDGLIEDLKDPEEAQAYLEATLNAYEEDGNTDALLLALGHVAKAQGGMGQLAKRTAVSREHWYDILTSQQTPRLDHWLAVLSALGFRVRLERAKVTPEPVPFHDEAGGAHVR
ncbi:putative addiction module antidote protein, partial [Candidatus Poribacteria bacterium]|nr:putative addiction module antidote protein [Candidatus Poribacteria bacterium]